MREKSFMLAPLRAADSASEILVILLVVVGVFLLVWCVSVFVCRLFSFVRTGWEDVKECDSSHSFGRFAWRFAFAADVDIHA